jgi:tetratricopeptide (TPR) repeat protein
VTISQASNAFQRPSVASHDQAIGDPRSQGADSLLGLIYLYKSRCYLELKDFNSARTSVENCLRIIPNNFIALGIRGDLLVEEKRFQDAFKDYTQGLLGSPEYMVCLMGRAYCLAATSQFDEAAKCYEAAWRVDFSNQEAKESAVYCTISMIMSRLATPARNAYLRPNIPESKLKQAFQTYLSPRGLRDISKILLLYDNTLFGGAEDGFCLTSDELYWHNAWEAVTHSIYYSTIISTTVSPNKNLLVNQIKVECASGGGVDLWMHIIDALVQLHARIQSFQTAKNATHRASSFYS